ncbi:MAG TPA: DinB family protein [Dehalococcoidia bacterium]
MGRTGVEQLLYLMDQAFEPEPRLRAHSLLSNLVDVHDEDWLLNPLGGGRNVASIAEHVGECKFMYANQAFDDARMNWHDFDPRYVPELPAKAAMIDWLREGHAYLRGYVENLDDGELTVKRKWHPGPMMETRWLVSTMIEHDLYHAGEINHIRALVQGNDAWPQY